MVLIIINKMCLDLVIFARKLSHPRRNVKHPRVIKSPQMSRINPPRPHKYPQGLDINPIASYNTYSNTHGAHLCRLRIRKLRSSVIGSPWNLRSSKTSTRINLTGRKYSSWNQLSVSKHMWKT